MADANEPFVDLLPQLGHGDYWDDNVLCGHLGAVQRGLDALDALILWQDACPRRGDDVAVPPVPSKDDLLDGLVEALLAEIEIPPPESGSWDRRAARMAHSLQEITLRHPAWCRCS